MAADRARLLKLAARYVWWAAPETTVDDNLPQLIAQAMQLGTWEDAHELLDLVGRDAFVQVLRTPPVGVLSPRSWRFWHRRLDLGEPPPLPVGRRLPAKADANDLRA
jgi:hypothetical protein